MGQRSGVGVVELAILEVLDARRARPGRRAIRCEHVLATLEDEMGLDRKYAYQVLADSGQPWKLPVPLIDTIGNFGSRGSDPPASPRYTEARLSPAGQLALAAERGQIAPVPIGMINGNTHREGLRPPFRPAAVIDAIRQVLHRPRLPGSVITGIVGPPDFVTGCTVTGDLAALARWLHGRIHTFRHGDRGPCRMFEPDTARTWLSRRRDTQPCVATTAAARGFDGPDPREDPSSMCGPVTAL